MLCYKLVCPDNFFVEFIILKITLKTKVFGTKKFLKLKIMDLKKELENINVEDWKFDDLYDLQTIIQKKIDQRLQLIITGDYEGRTT